MERYRNEKLLELTMGSYLIHDSMIRKLEIYASDKGLCIDISFVSIDFSTNKRSILKLYFIGVTEYSLNWDASYAFYRVDSYKFLKFDKGFYLSLDPYLMTQEVSDDDNDVIFAKEVEGEVAIG